MPYKVYLVVIYTSSIRIFVILIVILDLECRAFNIVTAYLNAIVLDEDIIYIVQLIGFINGIDRVCKLNKAFYSL